MKYIIHRIVEVSDRMPSKGIYERMSKLTEEVGELAGEVNKGNSPDDFIKECADVLIVLVDIVNKHSGMGRLSHAVDLKLRRWESLYGEDRKGVYK